MSPLSFKLIEADNIQSIIPLLVQLDETISEPVLQQRLQQMLEQGYQCVGIYDGEKLVGMSGLWILTKYYVGRHIEPDNVYILPEYRGQGIGQQLMKWIYQFAAENDCVASELNCYVTNEAGRKFWESEGYDPIGIHYQKKLP
jgi:GNAT superfamily N-acetyltransferase